MQNTITNGEGVPCATTWGTPGAEKAAMGAVVNQITKAMNAAAAGAEGVEGSPVVLARNLTFYIHRGHLYEDQRL